MTVPPRATLAGQPPGVSPVHAFLEQLADGVLLVDPAGRVAFANGPADALLGGPGESLRGVEVAGPLGREVEHACARAVESRSAEVVSAVPAPGGRWLDVRVSPSDGGAAVLLVDVTAREGARADEHALREADRQLRRVVDSLPAGAAYVEGSRVAVNSAVERLTGFRRDELATLDAWFGTLFGSRAGVVRRMYEADRAAGFPEPRRLWVATRDRGARLFEITARATDDLDVWIVQDVTTREHTERTLRERELQLAEAQRIAAVGSWTWDFVSRRAAWTDEMYRIYDRDPAAGPAVGAEFYGCLHPDDRAPLRARLRVALSRRDPQLEMEFRVARPGRGARRVVVRAEIRYDAAGKPAVMTGTNQDVTDRRQLEAQFRQAQKMEAVGQLAGGIAHDFNNLLTAIDANAELSLTAVREFDRARAPTALLATVSADLQEIRRATSRAADLTRQLLAFSRRQLLDARPVDVNEVVTQAMPLIRRLVSTNIAIDTVLAPSPRTVVVDAHQLEQVLMNLVVNARDAVRDAELPRITVATLDVVVSTPETRGTVVGGSDTREALMPLGASGARTGLAPGPYTVLLVHDTGVGMDGETLAHIFEPFFTTKRVGEGTGLGLSTVYGIVKQSGGYVYADSAPGRGTLCTVYLPVAKADAAAARGGGRARSFDRASAAPSGSYEAVIADALPALAPHGARVPAAGASGAAEPGAAASGRTVLLVEDEPPVRMALRRLLQRAGHQVLEAAHGSEALALWAAHGAAVDLVVTDVVMPEVGGLALVERLRADRPRLPVLYISGHSENSAPPHAPLGARTEWLTKPFKMTTIMRTVADLLSEDVPAR
jgi:PAS domain S-box-containing protein